MRTDTQTRLWAALLCSILSQVALAQQDAGEAPDEGTSGEGAADFSRNMQIDVRLDARTEISDNFYYEASGERDVAGFVLNPSINVTRQGNLARTSLSGGLTGAAYSFNRRDNYLDASANLAQQWSLARDQDLTLRAGFRRGHDPFGSDRTEGSEREDTPLDEWNHATAGVDYRKLAALGKGAEFGVGVGYVDRDYVTNEDQTTFLDYRRRSGQLTIGWRFSPKTVSFLQYRRIETKFDIGGDTGRRRSGDADILLLGGRWFATAKTSADVAVGAGRRRNDGSDSASDDFENAYWAVQIDWALSPRTSFELATNRAFLESYRANADFIDQRETGLEWVQIWNSRFRSRVGASYRDVNFVNSPDDDNYLRGSLHLSYRIGPATSIYLGSNSSRRDSSRPGLDFERTRAFLGFSTALN